MIKFFFAAAFFCGLIFTLNFQTSAKSTRAVRYPYIQNERLLPLAFRELYDAQNIYQETAGNGNFGTFNNLVSAGLVSSTWQANFYRKYGYVFQMNSVAFSGNFAASFSIKATPLKYRRTGRKSFYADHLGVLRADDKNGSLPIGSEPVIGNFSYTPLTARSDRRMIRTLRMIHASQVTYQATTGNGNFAMLIQLQIPGMSIGTGGRGWFGGYDFVLTKTDFTSTAPASFKLTATPNQYNLTGIRSFYIDETGALRGADKNGAAANADDTIIENECLPNEECTIANLRTLHSAEITYQATVGNNNFGTLAQLHAANLINELLVRGYANGYNFAVTIFPRVGSNPPSFTITAVPITYGATGIRSFYIDESGVIRGADKQGAPATADDPVVE